MDKVTFAACKEELLSQLITKNGNAEANLMLKDIIIQELEQKINGLTNEIYALNEMIKQLKEPVESPLEEKRAEEDIEQS